MGRGRKMLSWIALSVLLISNVITPWTYAENEDPEVFDMEEIIELITPKGISDDNIKLATPKAIEENSDDNINDNEKHNEDTGDLEQQKIENSKLDLMDDEPTPDNCFEWDWLFIKKYLCDSTEIIIPENVSWVYWEAFAWKTIENIVFLSSDTMLFQQIFSGAVLQWKMTLPWNNRSQWYMLEWATVWEEWEITLNQWMRTYHSTILWKVIVDWTKWSYQYLFQNSLIDWEVVLSWFTWKIEYAFYGSTLTENWKIIIWEWPDEIYNSFQRINWEWEIRGQIIFPESLKKIGQSFYWIPINTHIDFPKGLKRIENSFYESNNFSVIFQSWLQFSWNQELDIEYAFNDVEVDWDVSIMWSWISLKNFAPSIVSWNVIISWENVYLKDWSFYYYQSWGSKINGSVIISGNNIGEMRGFTNAKIWEDFNVYWNTINLNYWLWGQAFIQWDILISWNNIESKYGSTTNLNVSGNVIMTGDFLDLGYWFLSPSNIDWNIIIKGNKLNLMYTSLNSANVGWNMDIESPILSIWYSALEDLKIGWNLNISGNVEYYPSSLTNIEAKNLILNTIDSKPQMKILTWNLIINNSNNMLDEVFSWVIVSDNIYLNWEISTVWANAYKFSSWNIQPIILSATFSTWDIGENAFCMEWKPLVLAYTKKKLTQSEKDYLRNHACLNAMGTYTLTFKSWDRTETLEYDWRNIDEIPVREKIWYKFSWWYETWAIQAFDFTWTEIMEDKTFYAKWNANIYTVSFNADNGETNPGNITVTYDSQYPELPVVNKTWYTFSWWYNWEEMVSSWNIVKITEDVILKAKRKMNQYKIIFDTDGWNEISPIEKDYNSVINITLPTPTKECNEFSWWDTELPERMPAHDITLKAIWEYTCSRSSWGGWWAKKAESTTREIAIDTSTDQEHNSADEGQKTETNETSNTPTNWETSNQIISVTQEISEDGTPIEVVVQTVTIKNTDIVATVRTEIPSSNTTRSSSSSKTHTKEENDAYSFAKSNGITTTDSIDNAKMNTELTRIQMAKMLSNYAINVLWQEPDVSKWTIKFDDVTNKMDKQYDNAVTKAYQLWIMWQNMKNNEFRPSDTVTRAEFASALSRLLYQTEEWEYKWTWKYYIPHVSKLYNEWIVNKTDPEIKEKRWYVMTMLMRTVE